MTLTDAGTGVTCFETSGSTGPARRWVRSHEQMVREVALIGDTLIGPVDFVINYAPPRHLFGALFGQWLPRCWGVPVNQSWMAPFEFPQIEPGSRVLVVCVPIAWHLLRRNMQSMRAAASITALHSTAVPPAAAYELVRTESPLLRAHEILGSTETGGIAYRPLDPADQGMLWRAFSDVLFARATKAVVGATEELVVESPRLARPENTATPPARWATGDLVEFTGSDTFRLVGRSSSLVKVNGRRVHLSRIDQHLSQCLPGAVFATLAVPGDSLAGEGYAVFWSLGGSGVGLSDVRSALRDFPSPTRIVQLASVPTTVMGKPDRRLLASLL